MDGLNVNICEREFLHFIFQNSFESSVSFLDDSKLKDLLWLLYFFKCGSCYTYINVFAVGFFIAYDDGFV